MKQINLLVELEDQDGSFKNEKYIELNPEILRKNDPIRMVANPKKINTEVGWKTETTIESMIEKIIKSKIK